MADTLPYEHESTTVELLLRNENYLDIVLPQWIEVKDGLYFLNSKLGWILTGRTSESEVNEDETSVLILTYGTNLCKKKCFHKCWQCHDIKTWPWRLLENEVY